MAEKEEQNKQTPIQDLVSELYHSGQLFRPLDEIRATAPPLEPLWGSQLFRKAVTSIVGDPGVCKTTFGYGWATTLCNNEPFLNISAEEPIYSVYCDWESADSLVASRGNFVASKSVSNLFIFNSVELYLNSFASKLVEFCRDKGINLVFLDNQSMAFPTKDENDNAEAIKQMRFLRSVANACNASFILFHHTSKANLPGTRKGTGAFARARLADVCINIDIPDENIPDIIRFEVVKNRLLDDNTLWYLKKEEGQFTFTDPPLGVAGTPTDNTLIYKVQQEIVKMLSNSQNMLKRYDIITMLEAAGFAESTTHSGLKRLKRIGKIQSPQYGFYQLRKLV